MKHNPDDLPDLIGDNDVRRFLRAEHENSGHSRDRMAKRYGVTYPTIANVLSSSRGHVSKKILRTLGYDVRERFYKKRKPKNGD